MRQHRNQIVDSETLLFTWHILNESRKRNDCNISPSHYLFIDYKVFDYYKLGLILKKLIKNNVIEDLCIKKSRHDNKADTRRLIEIDRLNKEKINQKKGGIFEDDIIHFLDAQDSSLIWDFDMTISSKEVKSFIEDYLMKWKNNELIFPDKNILRSDEQLKHLVSTIYWELKKYPPKNLLIGRSNFTHQDESDFVAMMLFLEEINNIKIKKICFANGNWFFRVDVEDKFFSDFSADGFFVTLDDNVDEVIRGHREGKAIPKKHKIKLKAPKILEYRGVEHKINEGTTPYHLINLAKENKGVINYKNFRKLTRMPKERDKDLKEFRRRLKGKFELRSSELLFEIKGGQIIFDMELFDFS